MSQIMMRMIKRKPKIRKMEVMSMKERVGQKVSEEHYEQVQLSQLMMMELVILLHFQVQHLN